MWLPEHGTHLVRPTLAEAERTAYGYAADHSPCDVVVQDAYRRVRSRRQLGTG